MNVVDSSGWLSYFADDANAVHFQAVVRDTNTLVIPVITLYEVSKILTRQTNRSYMLECLGHMQQGHVVNLDADLALHAAQLSQRHSLPMADSLILATARMRDAVLWTQDADFAGLDNVRYFPKAE